jgi:hypothetical protein
VKIENAADAPERARTAETTFHEQTPLSYEEQSRLQNW